MTTVFPTKEYALETGAYYGGYADPTERTAALKKATIVSMDLGWPHSIPADPETGRPEIKKTLEVHVITNINNLKLGLGVSKFRNGYDLWLINMKTGHSRRA